MEDKIITLRKLIKKYCDEKNKALNGMLFPDNGFVPGLDDGKWSDADILWIGFNLSDKNDMFLCPHCLKHAVDRFIHPITFGDKYHLSRFDRHCGSCEYGKLYGVCSNRSSFFQKDQYAKLLKTLNSPSIVHFLRDYPLPTFFRDEFRHLQYLIMDCNKLAYEIWGSMWSDIYPGYLLDQP